MDGEARNTLPELLFVVAGMSLLPLTVSARALAGSSIEGADLVEQVHVALQAARLDAVSRGAICRMTVDPRAGRLEVRGGDDDRLLQRLTLAPGETLAWVGPTAVPDPGARFEVAFDSQGRPLGGPGEIVVGSDETLAGVEVLADGEFRVAER